MTLRERCEEILRLIDDVVDADEGMVASPTRGRPRPVPAVVEAPGADLRSRTRAS